MLSETAGTDLVHEAEGNSVGEVLGDLFREVPGLRHHIVDESGAIRPHVAVFVDGVQADHGTVVAQGSEIRVLHAVSGGSGRSSR